jgi:hypothetical protein
MTVTELITIAIAIYGAVISTILGVAEILRNRTNVRVTARHGRLITADGKNSELMIILEATNTGKGTVTLTGVG